MSGKYLRNEDDSLIMRESGDYAKDKLTILQHSVSMFTTSMRGKPWTALNYIDLQAGSGKNRLSPSGEIRLGSPLVSLTTQHPFGNYFFVESGKQEFAALKTRVQASPLRNRVNLYNQDCNIAIDEIISRLNEIDRERMPGEWSSLNLAFIDPEGLEIQWKTIEKLGKQSRMDLIINFSTSGITRNASNMVNIEQETIIDRFFGTARWRDIYKEVESKGVSRIRRRLLDFYIDRLNQLGYVNNLQENLESKEKEFKNRRNVQIYTLIFASKHELGIKFWNDAINEIGQLKLF